MSQHWNQTTILRREGGKVEQLGILADLSGIIIPGLRTAAEAESFQLPDGMSWEWREVERI